MKTLILGLGNPFFSYDRIGLIVANKLYKRLKGKDIFLKKTTLSGLNILGLISGYERVIIVDSIVVGKKDLGRCFKIRPRTKGYSHYSYHQMGIFQILDLAKKMNLDLPKNLEIYGIGVPPSRGLSQSLSLTLKNRVDTIVNEVYEDICMD